MLVVDVAAGVLANDTDPDDDVLSVAQVVAGPSNGRLELGDDGSFSYTPFQPGGVGTSYSDIDLTRFSLANIESSASQPADGPENLVDGYPETP